MKKCPYCKTLTDDDAVTCPHCLHDISTLRPMPEPISKRFNSFLYGIIFGVIFIIGGLVAALSQFGNMKHYLELSKNPELTKEEVNEFVRLSKMAGMEMSFMYVLCGIGAILVIVSLVLMIRKYIKDKKSKESIY